MSSNDFPSTDELSAALEHVVEAAQQLAYSAARLAKTLGVEHTLHGVQGSTLHLGGDLEGPTTTDVSSLRP